MLFALRIRSRRFEVVRESETKSLLLSPNDKRRPVFCGSLEEFAFRKKDRLSTLPALEDQRKDGDRTETALSFLSMAPLEIG